MSAPSRSGSGFDHGDGLVVAAICQELPGVVVGATATPAATASATPTIAAVVGKRLYLTGLTITSEAIAGTGLITLTGLAIGTVNFRATSTTSAGMSLIWTPAQPIPALDTNTALVLSWPAIGAGPAAAINLYGFMV